MSLHDEHLWVREVTEHPVQAGKVTVKCRREKTASTEMNNMPQSNCPDAFVFTGDLSDTYEVGQELLLDITHA